MINELVNRVVNNVKDLNFICGLLDEAIEILNYEYEKYKGLIEVPTKGNYLVVGDLHGDLTSLKYILGNVGVLDDFNLIFLGDYVDRGRYQLETISSILYIKLRHPDKVFILRGNHEPPDYLPVYPHDFPKELMRAYGILDGRKIYSKFTQLFQLLPHALIIEHVALMLHGGPPVHNISTASSRYEYLLGVNDEDKARILENVLWNDPIEEEPYFLPSYRGAGYMFGYKITEAALQKTNTVVIVRGHEPCINGFKFNHNMRVITIFSRLGAPYDNDAASFMKLKITDHDVVASDFNKVITKVANSIITFTYSDLKSYL